MYCLKKNFIIVFCGAEEGFVVVAILVFFCRGDYVHIKLQSDEIFKILGPAGLI